MEGLLFFVYSPLHIIHLVHLFFQLKLLILHIFLLFLLSITVVPRILISFTVSNVFPFGDNITARYIFQIKKLHFVNSSLGFGLFI